MKNTLTLSLAPAVLIGFILMTGSCRKDDDQGQAPPPPKVGQPLLKEIIIQNLPSPYFRFDYNSDSSAKEISFASGLSTWSVEYDNKKIKSLTNLKQPSKLFYFYSGSNVTRIRTDNVLSGKTEWANHFQYDNFNRLIKITWYQYASNGTDSVKFRETKFNYTKDFNLSGYEQFGRQDNGSFVLVATASYTNYDAGNNVDGFVIYKQFFEDFLYLPNVRLQLNNPRKQFLKTGVNEYQVEYTYQYNNDNPRTKRTKITQTKGSQAGTTTESLTQYSYY
ncbi:hypothetical protein [Pollutibacter soli]|uniref:hypothetical protein n=1 Tax=Pollutibacter soli TaxID=3034157 RepID=UPI003013BDA8